MKKEKMLLYAYSKALAYYKSFIPFIPADLLDIAVEDMEHPLVHYFINLGYSVRAYQNVDLADYPFIVCDEWNFLYSHDFEYLLNGKRRFCCLRHAVDQSGRMIPHVQYSIRAHQMIAAPCDVQGLFVTQKNGKLFDQALSLDPSLKTEYAYTGPYHMQEWLNKKLSRQERFDILEDELKCILDKEKPVVAFFLDEYGLDKSLIIGLKHLAKHATIIYKGLEDKDSRLLALGKAVIPWNTVDYAPNSLRFCADYILAGYYSGTFASALMVGLRVLPYYTKDIYRSRTSKIVVGFEELLPKSSVMSINQKCFVEFGSLFDIEDTARMVETMHDEVFWNVYAQNLERMQARAFGAYSLDDVARKTAALIIRAFLRGSFGKDTYAITFST